MLRNPGSCSGATLLPVGREIRGIVERISAMRSSRGTRARDQQQDERSVSDRADIRLAAGSETSIRINESRPADVGAVAPRSLLFTHTLASLFRFSLLSRLTGLLDGGGEGFLRVRASEASTRIYTAITKSRTFRWLL